MHFLNNMIWNISGTIQGKNTQENISGAIKGLMNVFKCVQFENLAWQFRDSQPKLLMC